MQVRETKHIKPRTIKKTIPTIHYGHGLACFLFVITSWLRYDDG